MFVARRAAAEQDQRFTSGIPQLVLLSGRDGNGVSGAYVGKLAFDSHPAGALSDKIDFLGFGMVMFLRARPGRKTRLGETLIANGGIPVGQQFADLGAVLGDKGGSGVTLNNFHPGSSSQTHGRGKAGNTVGGRGTSGVHCRVLACIARRERRRACTATIGMKASGDQKDGSPHSWSLPKPSRGFP